MKITFHKSHVIFIHGGDNKRLTEWDFKVGLESFKSLPVSQYVCKDESQKVHFKSLNSSITPRVVFLLPYCLSVFHIPLIHSSRIHLRVQTQTHFSLLVYIHKLLWNSTRL